MGLIVFDEMDEQRLVAEQYSTGRGPVLRSDVMELTKISFTSGNGAELHQHPEEQVLYVLEGVLDVTVGNETYEVHPGQASFHPSNVPHRAMAIQDVVALSFKHLVAPNYEKSGDLT